MTNDLPITWLFGALALLLLCSGFFSMSETCMMALNRYRLRHLIKQGSRGARYAGALLEKTEEMLSFILAGNTVLNAATTILVAEICRRLFLEADAPNIARALLFVRGAGDGEGRPASSARR